MLYARFIYEDTKYVHQLIKRNNKMYWEYYIGDSIESDDLPIIGLSANKLGKLIKFSKFRYWLALKFPKLVPIYIALKLIFLFVCFAAIVISVVCVVIKLFAEYPALLIIPAIMIPVVLVTIYIYNMFQD